MPSCASMDFSPQGHHVEIRRSDQQKIFHANKSEGIGAQIIDPSFDEGSRGDDGQKTSPIPQDSNNELSPVRPALQIHRRGSFDKHRGEMKSSHHEDFDEKCKHPGDLAFTHEATLSNKRVPACTPERHERPSSRSHQSNYVGSRPVNQDDSFLPPPLNVINPRIKEHPCLYPSQAKNSPNAPKATEGGNARNRNSPQHHNPPYHRAPYPHANKPDSSFVNGPGRVHPSNYGSSNSSSFHPYEHHGRTYPNMVPPHAVNSSASGVGQKRHRLYSDNAPKGGHRGIDSQGNSVTADRNGQNYPDHHNNHGVTNSSNRKLHHRDNSAGLNMLSAAADVPKEDLAAAVGGDVYDTRRTDSFPQNPPFRASHNGNNFVWGSNGSFDQDHHKKWTNGPIPQSVPSSRYPLSHENRNLQDQNRYNYNQWGAHSSSSHTNQKYHANSHDSSGSSSRAHSDYSSSFHQDVKIETTEQLFSNTDSRSNFPPQVKSDMNGIAQFPKTVPGSSSFSSGSQRGGHHRHLSSLSSIGTIGLAIFPTGPSESHSPNRNGRKAASAAPFPKINTTATHTVKPEATPATFQPSPPKESPRRNRPKEVILRPVQPRGGNINNAGGGRTSGSSGTHMIPIQSDKERMSSIRSERFSSGSVSDADQDQMNNSERNSGTSGVSVSSNNGVQFSLSPRNNNKRVRRKCSMPMCDNRVVQGGLCISHGAKRKTCSYEGCTKNVKKAGLCSTHGPARKRCETDSCAKVAVQGGKCIAHGARKKMCSIETCTKQAIITGMCKKHHDGHMGIPSNKRGKKNDSTKSNTNSDFCVVLNNEMGPDCSQESQGHQHDMTGHNRCSSFFTDIHAVETIIQDNPLGNMAPVPFLPRSCPDDDRRNHQRNPHADHRRGLSMFHDENFAETIIKNTMLM